MAVTTISGFSGPPTASQTFGTLRLPDPNARVRRRRRRSRSPTPQRVPDSDTRTLRPKENGTVRVTGYDAYATTAIRTATATAAGEDVLALPWAGGDSVISLMKRIEDLLCIPLMYWRLACDGEVLDPTASTITHPHFLNGPIVDLVLVPLGALEQFADDHKPATTPRLASQAPEVAASSMNIAEARGAQDGWSSLTLTEAPRDGGHR
ncbi:uncharacterized protein B0H18DRAFT_1117837 [Fomitopsis serialis]|uniref:uncharacterized protein n=1 Tax=Fomitopsis serialis TaxID=139415 RepID=UPI0020075B65|nr:uncharacterized protein B0H18DRAFT_1117837 [Neoantrodia serialis]KAH9928644.1 hypothetical protein B0H18DRAFT_1117837 [Neoantrodia serialis]